MTGTIHPVEDRYQTKAMAEIFTDEAKLLRWLRVEAALAKSHAANGNIPQAAADEIDKKANLTFVKLDRVKAIEDEIHHDLMAMVKALTEQCQGDAGKFVHLDATSYDIEDTATALQLSKGLDVLEKSVLRIIKALTTLMENTKGLVCVGRTHGQQALPTTYGMRFGVWATELARHIDRLKEARKRICVGKMSGAVGTMASFGEKGFEIQNKVMEILSKECSIKLEPAMITNQIIQRDRHAEVINLTGLIAGTLDKMAREHRILQRTEIAEMFEPFSAKQVGSSTMPHKRNPHRAERICSLARVIKANLIIGIDNMVLEDERDLTNSASERIIFGENFVLLDYMLSEEAGLLEKVEFDYEGIKRNLNFTHGAFLAENVMVTLVEKGIGRQDGHEMLRQAAITARKQNRPMKSILLDNPVISSKLTEIELDELLTPENYIGTATQQVERVIAFLKKNYLGNSK